MDYTTLVTLEHNNKIDNNKTREIEMGNLKESFQDTHLQLLEIKNPEINRGSTRTNSQKMKNLKTIQIYLVAFHQKLKKTFTSRGQVGFT